MKIVHGLMLGFLVTIGGEALAATQSTLDMHEGCEREVLALKDFGTYVIEPFLPEKDGQKAYPQVQEMLAFVRESVGRVTHECAPYTDLQRAFLALNLLYSSYTLIAEGEVPEIDASNRPDFLGGFSISTRLMLRSSLEENGRGGLL